MRRNTLPPVMVSTSGAQLLKPVAVKALCEKLLPLATLVTPNLDEAGKYQAVEVPTGFVTDFASIPPIFFSVLRPDGEYAYAAVIHDYLYWTQTRPREVADEIFKLAMQDLKVNIVKLTAIYEAVRQLGGKAWNDNARLKSQGEKRILVKFPDDPTINWDDWKKRSGVFAT